MKTVAFSVALTLSLAGCAKPTPDTVANVTGNASATVTAANETDNVAEAPRSILRPEVVEKGQPPKIEPVEAVIAFGASPMKLDDAAHEAIDALIDAPATEAGGAITLFGHSDSRGSDGDNKVASRIRAERVRDYLVERGIVKERITLVALGEGRPIAPNVKDDGSDNPEGRAKNRRVEIAVAVPPQANASAKDETAKP